MLCRKCTVQNRMLSKILDLLSAQDEPGVPKLGYY